MLRTAWSQDAPVDRSHLSTKRRLVEAAQLARVQAVDLALEDVDCGQTDPEMLADRAFVKSDRRAGQLDLAMQRLVGHAQQSSIRHAHAEALRGDRARFHVDR